MADTMPMDLKRKHLAQFECLTPREIVAQLDEYIVGQAAAKRAIAVAIRNRLRRLQVGDDLRDEIIPKNLILIGPTGVGKTEIARRMARLLKAPFIKVEATKYTETGYVGRDVDSIIRDLTEHSVRLVRQEKLDSLEGTLAGRVNDRIVDLLQPLPARARRPGQRLTGATEEEREAQREQLLREAAQEEEQFEQIKRIREKFRKQLKDGKLDDQEVTIEAPEGSGKLLQVFTSQGMEEMGMDLQNLFDNMGDKKTRKRKVAIGEARRILMQEEAERAIDMDAVVREAIERVELAGIVFIDEIDKIAHREGEHSHGPDVSREGVQREILPLVEGTTVISKYGPVRTHHVLFIAAGAFHVSRVADLIPEFQGRFPLRVELESLSEDDFGRILREPKNSLIRQYTALLATEGVALSFTEDALDALARIATVANRSGQNIGARRLFTVLEKVLEEVSFAAPYASSGAGASPVESTGQGAGATNPAGTAARPTSIVVDAAYVETRLGELMQDKDVAGYIL